MEKKGIRTERGDINREIEVTNQQLRQLKARIAKLQSWVKTETENTEPPSRLNSNSIDLRRFAALRKNLTIGALCCIIFLNEKIGYDLFTKNYREW